MPQSDKKNVVLLIPQLRHGGAERVVSRLSYLLAEEYNIKIVVFDSRVITYDVGSEVISLDLEPDSKRNPLAKLYVSIRRIKKYKKFKSDNDIDITYSFGDTANIVNVFSGLYDKKIISIRGYKRIRMGTTMLDKLILRPISRLICKKSDRIVAVSDLIKETIAKEYKIDSDKIITSYNGYDIEAIQLLAKEALPNEWNDFFISNPVLITAGTFRYEKGYWHLVKAFYLLQKDNPEVKLVILGEDYYGYKKKVVDLVVNLGIADSVFFLGYTSNPYKYFSKSKMYILSSVFEGFPNAMVEAMATGIPVVACDCNSGPREILAPSLDIFAPYVGSKLVDAGVLTEKLSVVENFNSEIFEQSDYSLADGMKILLDADLREKYVRIAQKRAGEFDYNVWLKTQLRILNFEDCYDL